MEKPIKLAEAAEYYSLLPHQTEAWTYLEDNTRREVLSEFAKLYRKDTAETEETASFRSPSTGHMSETGISLVKYFEGCELETYLCSSGIPTLGYGSTGPNIQMGMKITQEKAEQMLLDDLRVFEDAIKDLINARLQQSHFDALVSWAMNVGVGAVSESTLRRRINKGEAVLTVIQQELPRWNKGPNGPLPGLIKRRKAEVRLAETGRFG